MAAYFQRRFQTNLHQRQIRTTGSSAEKEKLETKEGLMNPGDGVIASGNVEKDQFMDCGAKLSGIALHWLGIGKI